jgi:uncharacterized damage-inducible protein DinB
MPIADFLLPEFDQEMAKTRTTLERCPEDKFGWTPHVKSWKMAQLATHIANIPCLAVEAISKDSYDVSPAGAPPHKAEPVRSRKDLLERFDRNVAAARAAVAGTSDDQFMKPWTLLFGGKAIFTMPRVAVVRAMVMSHSIHHRAQLGVYLRLNDIPVPAIYGPSADESGM